MCETAEMMGRPAALGAMGGPTLLGIYRDNPNGVFAALNPKVTCANHLSTDSTHVGHIKP